MPPGYVCIRTRWPLAGLDIEPDVVVVGVKEIPHGDVAEDDLTIGCGRPGRREGAAVRFLGRAGPCSAGSRNRRPSRPVAVASRAFSRKLVSTSALIVTRSSRSIGRPSHLAPAAAAPSAIPFISSRYSRSNRRKKSASAISRKSCQASAGALVLRYSPDLADETGDLRRHQAGRADSPVRKALLRCAARSSRLAGSDNPPQSAGPRPGPVDKTARWRTSPDPSPATSAAPPRARSNRVTGTGFGSRST